MLTVKVVVIGASGVGKTSLRGQYISGRFSNGYRATIGADFITKVLPHPSNPDESVTLQIWDTAGQERFSSLSTAFFRGADAAILMFDVNTPATKDNLKKWWDEFCVKAPLADKDMEEYCCVVVGNKIDLVGSGKGVSERVTEADGLEFIRELIPNVSPETSPGHETPPLPPEGRDFSRPINVPVISNPLQSKQPENSKHASPSSPLQASSNAISIIPNLQIGDRSSRFGDHIKSRSRSSSRFFGSTMTNASASVTIYHTPSSSVFDIFQSARSSPEPRLTPPLSPTQSLRRRRISTLSSSSKSSESALTITPSLFARRSSNNGVATETNLTTPNDEQPSPNPLSTPFPPTPLRGAKLLFTSAKTGEGVADVFEYIAHRVIRKWEYDEAMESRGMLFRETSTADTIRLGLDNGSRGSFFRKKGKVFANSCCS